jgi:hypothetical protein
LWPTSLPPVWRFPGITLQFDRLRQMDDVAVGGVAELPELGRRTLVVEERLIDLELVELACIQANNCAAHMLEQQAELLSVVLLDERVYRGDTDEQSPVRVTPDLRSGVASCG